MIKKKSTHYNINILNWIIPISSIASALFLLVHYDTPNAYRLLPLVPIAFAISSVVFKRVTESIPGNVGVTILVFLLFFRYVVLPLIMQYGDYANKFENAVNETMPTAICLSIYEIFAIFFTLWIFVLNNQKHSIKIRQQEQWIFYSVRNMSRLIFLMSVFFVGTIIIAPENLKFYQSILDINKAQFTGNETYSVIGQYGVSFVKKLVMVLHMYLMKVLRFLIPLHIIVLLYQKFDGKRYYGWCVLVSCSNILVVDGSISRSIVYVVVLLILTSMIYKKESNITKIFFVAASFIFLYFFIRSSVTGNSLSSGDYISQLLVSYFSGIPNTAACLNLDLSTEDKLVYLLYDYLQAIPFGNTFFNLQDISFQGLFNSVNSSFGQIPTTIGVGYLYFGGLLAPLYSVLFTIIAYRAGMVASNSNNVLKRGIAVLSALYAAMGIVMYYIQITIVILISIILPMIIIVRITEKRKYLSSASSYDNNSIKKHGDI